MSVCTVSPVHHTFPVSGKDSPPRVGIVQSSHINSLTTSSISLSDLKVKNVHQFIKLWAQKSEELPKHLYTDVKLAALAQALILENSKPTNIIDSSSMMMGEYYPKDALDMRIQLSKSIVEHLSAEYSQQIKVGPVSMSEKDGPGFFDVETESISFD